MKKILIKVLIVALVAVLSVIGTLAYLTATDEVTNVMVVDDASIEIVEYERVNTDDKNTNAAVQAFNNNKRLRPSVLANGATYAAPDASYNANFSVDANTGKPIKANYTYPIWNPNNIANEIDKMVFVKNTGDCNVYVRLCFAFEAGNYVRLDRFKEMVHLNANETDWTWDWNDTRLVDIDGTRCFIAWATYQKPVAPGELTDISLAQIALDYTAINDHARAFGDTYDVKVFAQGIQSDGFTSPTTAIAKHFDNSIPFKDVKEVNFVDLPTALHYLNGENSGANKITQKVKNITFGLTGDYLEVVNAYDGVLVANKATQVDKNTGAVTLEADFTAYAYYVPNGENYDIYILADNWEIYTPNNSGGLFQDMKALTKVETSNLNVSATTNMAHMFHDAGIIQLDVSDWDVSNVTNMEQMFAACRQLTSLDCSRWKVDNVTKMNNMFHVCVSVTSLYLSDWNVSKVTTMEYMFSACGKLSYLDVSGWIFGDNDTVSVTNMGSMFNSCSNLEYIDVANWNVSKVTNMSGTFVGCEALKSLDVSRWNVGNVTTMQQMFDKCYNLAPLDVSKWNVSKVLTMNSMFQNASKLTKLDLSGWNTANVLNSTSMFNNCVNLKTIYVGDDWNMSNATASSSDMFKSCNQLPNYDASTVDASKAHAGAGGYLTKK